MEKKYYLVKKETSDTGRAFMFGLGKKLKHIAGDKSITDNLKFEKGNLTIKNSASNYLIFSLNELQFEQYIDQLKSQK